MNGERDEVRRQSAANPFVVAKRQRTVRFAIGMLVLAAVLGALAGGTRRQFGPTGFYTPPLGVAALFSALGLVGAALALPVNSPTRAPLPERIQMRVWHGRIGRTFLRWTMGHETLSATTPTRPTTRRTRAVAVVPRLAPLFAFVRWVCCVDTTCLV